VHSYFMDVTGSLETASNTALFLIGTGSSRSPNLDSLNVTSRRIVTHLIACILLDVYCTQQVVLW